MGRPRKYGEQPVNKHLRIPVTDEQKALIDRATADEPAGMANWARGILLTAANRKLARAAARSGSHKRISTET